MTIESKWNDDLIWMPSQLYLNIKHSGKFYVIYLRWRWDDPWSGYLCETTENYDVNELDYDWITLKSSELFCRHHDINDLKKAAIAEVEMILNTTPNT